MENKTEDKRIFAGLSPWLFISLMLLVYGLRHVPGLLQAGIHDIRRTEELGRVSYAVSNVEYEPPLKDKLSIDQMEAQLEHRRAHLSDWLMGGGCSRFKTSAARAFVDIQHAKYLSEKEKVFYRQLIQDKRHLLASELKKIAHYKLQKIAQQESGLNPYRMRKEEIINYLIDDEKQRERIDTRWEKRAPDLLERGPSSIQTEDLVNAKVFRARFDLVAIKLSLWLSLLLELSIFIIPLYGLLSVMLPHWRGWLVEKRFGLGKQPVSLAEFKDIQSFVAKNAPQIRVQANFLRPDFAFVYPKGYRSPRLAVFGGMYDLWRNDRERAQSFLLHEIEHVRQGDHLFVGYGTFFSYYIKFLFIGFIVLITAHVIFGTPVSVGVIKRLGYLQFGHLYSYSEHYDPSFVGQVFTALSAIVAICFLLMKMIIIPMMGIWASELNADYGACRDQTLYFDSLNPTTRLAQKVLRIIGSLTHPPLWLRKWLITKDAWPRSLIRHLVFPCSYLIAIFMFFLMGLFAKWRPEGLDAGTVIWLLELCRTSFANLYWLFGGMAILVLIWPRLAGYWERFFLGQRTFNQRWETGICVAALLLGFLAVLAWLLRSPL